MQFLAGLALIFFLFICIIIYSQFLIFFARANGYRFGNYIRLCDPNQNQLGFAACNIERDALIARGMPASDDIPFWIHLLSIGSTFGVIFLFLLLFLILMAFKINSDADKMGR